MQARNIWIWILPFVWSLLVAATNARGAECLESSPTVQAGKDPYLPLVVRELSPDEQAAVKGLLTSLDGEWRGQAMDVDCRDIKDPEDKVVNRYVANAEVDVDYYGNFFIQVNLYSKQKKTNHRKVLRLYLTQKKLRVNSSSRYGDVELITVSPASIAFLYRLVLNSEDNKATNRKEIFVSLDWDGSRLGIQQQIYSQGRLSYRQRWHLQRR